MYITVKRLQHPAGDELIRNMVKMDKSGWFKQLVIKQ